MCLELTWLLACFEMYGTLVGEDKDTVWRVFSKRLDVANDIFHYV